MGTPSLWLQLSTVHCISLGFCSGHFHQALGRQGLGPQPYFAEQNLKPGFLGLCPEKTEAAEVRHGSSSLAVHPQPGGPDAVVLGHQVCAAAGAAGIKPNLQLWETTRLGESSDRGLELAALAMSIRSAGQGAEDTGVISGGLYVCSGNHWIYSRVGKFKRTPSLPLASFLPSTGFLLGP